MRKITLDIETKNLFSDVGSNDPTALDISIVCIHDSLDDTYKSFTEANMKDLWPILEHSDMIITWNGDHFDIPLLNKYYTGDLKKIKSLDLMKEVVNVLGRRLKLDTVAQASLGKAKSGNGLEAIEWWLAGEVDKIIKYCIDDVKLTKEVYEYAMANSSLKYKDNGTIKVVKLDTSSWEVPQSDSMTFTLPL